MPTKSILAKVKSLWKWIVSGIVASGAITIVVIKWLAAGAATTVVTIPVAIKTAAVGTVAVVVATAFTFSFADKGGHLTEYVDYAFQLLDEGKSGEAIKYTDKMIEAIDREIVIRQEKATNKDDVNDVDSKKTANILAKARVGRQSAELFRCYLRRRAGFESDKDYLAACIEILQADTAGSKSIIKSFLGNVGEQFSVEDAWTFLRTNAPSEVRGELAGWLEKKAGPKATASSREISEFYEELLAYSNDSDACSDLVNHYLRALRNVGDLQALKEVAETYIAIFSDSMIGVMAANYLLESSVNSIDKMHALISMVEKNPNSKVAAYFASDYVKALLVLGNYKKVINVLNSGSQQIGDTGEQEEAEYLVEQIGKMVSVPAHRAVSELSAGLLDIEETYLKCSEFLLTTGGQVRSDEFLLATLKKINACPVSLVTGRLIDEVEEFGCSGDIESEHKLATYLFSILRKALSREAVSDGIVASGMDALPESLIPYVFLSEARKSLAVGDYEAALRDTDNALAIMPESPVLAEFRAGISNKMMQAKRISDIKEQLRQLLVKVDSAKTSIEAAKLYRRIAEHHLSLGEIEQSVGANLFVVERFPETEAAPAAIARSITILESEDKGKYAARIKRLRKMLADKYPDSIEARRYRSIGE